MSAGRHVVVVGAGATGSSAALALARAGNAVTLVEREARLGGVHATIERKGFRFHLGGHRFLRGGPETSALVDELVGDELHDHAPSSVVLHQGRTLRFPLELADVLRSQPMARARDTLAGFLAARKKARVDERTFEDWAVHRFGPQLHRELLGPFAEKLWGVGPAQLSAAWVDGRLRPLSLSDAALRLVGLRGGRPRGEAAPQLVPRLGTGRLFERMAEAIRAAGGAVVTETRVTGLSLAGGKVRAVRCAGISGERELPCDALVATLPLSRLALLLGDGSPPPSVLRAAGRLRHRAVRLHHILLDMPEVSPHAFTWVADPRLPMSRIEEPRHLSPALAPEGKTSLTLELPCDVGGTLWTAEDAEVHERCVAALRTLGFSGIGEATMAHFSSFLEEAGPVLHLGHEEDRAAVLEYVDGFANVVPAGRQGAFRRAHMDAAMAMGLRAAEAVLSGAAAARRGARGLGDDAAPEAAVGVQA